MRIVEFLLSAAYDKPFYYVCADRIVNRNINKKSASVIMTETDFIIFIIFIIFNYIFHLCSDYYAVIFYSESSIAIYIGFMPISS